MSIKKSMNTVVIVGTLAEVGNLVYDKEVPLFEKYDEFVPPELIRKGFAYGILDIDEMKKRILSWEKII